MIEWSLLGNYITVVAGFLSSLSIIVGVIYKWIWKPYAERKEAREEKWMKRMEGITSKQTTPLSNEIHLLADQSKKYDEIYARLEEITKQNVRIIREIREEFKDHNYQADQRDILIKQNADLIKKHEDRLEDYGERILILETVSGLKSRIVKKKEDK